MSDGVLCNLQGTTADTEAKAGRVKPSSLAWCVCVVFLFLTPSVPHSKSLIFDFIQKATRGSNIYYVRSVRTLRVVVNVRNPASLPVFKRHTATLRLPAKNHHKSTQRAAGESTVGCQPGSKSGSFTKWRKTASYQQYCPAYSNITPPNSPQWIRLASLASHHVPQVCNVHRRCGSSRAVFVHVYPRGTQSGRD